MRRKTAGQSLIEVLAALGVVVLVILALIIVTTISIRNATFAKNQSLATSYAQEAIEEIREYRDQNSWTAFVASCSSKTAMGLSDPSSPFVLSDPVCNIPETTNSCVEGDNRCEVKVTISWDDAKGSHQTELITYLAEWQ